MTMPAARFNFSLKSLKFELPWEQIKTWYPFVQTMNGFPTERAIIFETLKNEKIRIKTYHFADRSDGVADPLIKAAFDKQAT